MNWKKLVILVLAGLPLLMPIVGLINGIEMINRWSPGHRQHTEGLMLLILSALALIVIPLLAWRLL